MCLSVALTHPENVLGTGHHLGFEWCVTHNNLGYRCGYVRVPAGHPWHGKSDEEIDCDAHGGLTFSAPDTPCDKGGADDGWWIGFDCAHYGDAQDPALPASFKMQTFGDQTVRTQDYVEAECRSLCEQAAAVK